MTKSRAVYVVLGASLYLALFVVFTVLVDSVAQPASPGGSLLWPMAWIIYLALPPLAVATGLSAVWKTWHTSNRFSLFAATTLFGAGAMTLLPALVYVWRTYEHTLTAVSEERVVMSTVLHLPTITSIASALALTVLMFIGHRVFGTNHEKTRPA
ncbi:MAG: hypothetical protein QUV02_06000 [Maricaulis sp.]|uniref:hypothetical protein n=1 Tax=Maricaulis sp. TaxID=1486257 RepID=UPI002633D8D2|nr:hypothetical protein [Maricaulis sp.]MDM7983984.1 hypothetical protein [Maricaulis sp.]